MKRNRYGYKICYREQGSKTYVRHFITYTYKQALAAMHEYIRYPPEAREDGHELKNPAWRVTPISKKEVADGIWRECPF